MYPVLAERSFVYCSLIMWSWLTLCSATADSHHHPANKQSVLTSLTHRAKALCDQDSHTQELEFLTTIFKDNGNNHQQIQQAMKPATQTAKTNEKPTSTAYIPYTQTTYGRLSRMLAKHNIRSVALPPR